MSRRNLITVLIGGVSTLALLIGTAAVSEAWVMRQTKRGNMVECAQGTEQMTAEGHVKACRQDVTKPFSPTNVAGNLVTCRKGSFTRFNDTGDLESCVIDNTFTVTPASGSQITCRPGQRATFDPKGWLVSCVNE